MKLLNFTLLTVITILPSLGFAQVGKRVITLSTGERTTQVQPTVKGADLKSLKRPAVDTMFYDLKPEYRSLEEAAYDADRILREIELSRKENRKTNNALSFAISNNLVKSERSTARIKEVWDSLAAQDADIETLKALKEIYGDKPTYYVNGVEVSEEVVKRIGQSDILRQTVKTTDAISDNPNGEIWYEVSEGSFRKLKIQARNEEADDAEEPVSVTMPDEGQINVTNLKAKGASLLSNQGSVGGNEVKTEAIPIAVNQKKSNKSVKEKASKGENSKKQQTLSKEQALVSNYLKNNKR